MFDCIHKQLFVACLLYFKGHEVGGTNCVKVFHNRNFVDRIIWSSMALSTHYRSKSVSPGGISFALFYGSFVNSKHFCFQGVGFENLALCPRVL